MVLNVKVYMWLAVFFLFFSVVYPTWVFLDGDPVEWVGTISIPLTMVMFLLMGGFLLLNLRRQNGGVLPEDNDLADVDDGDTDMGYYLPWSWWPFFAGAAGGLVMLGMSVGVWVALFSLGLVLITFIGWFYEPVRGAYRR
jgi:hypothetical protein